MDSDFQEWCTSILEFAEREDLDIETEAAFGDMGYEQSWATDTAASLSQFEDQNEQQTETSRSRSAYAGVDIKQQHRNATVFSLPEASRAAFRTLSTDDMQQALSPSPYLIGEIQLPSSNTLASGTSGGCQDHSQPPQTRRSPPFSDPNTLKILEGISAGRNIAVTQRS